MKKYQTQNKIPKKRVAIAMSGGVDSSTVAQKLSEQGYNCIGIFMRLGIERGCCDEAAARKVCQKIGIRFYPADVRASFKKMVKDYFIESYKQGLTPNPCVACNKFIKFGELLKKAKALGCDRLATGHYVKIKKIKGVYKVYRAKDLSKDQSYFLYNLTQEQLKHLIFPLGDSFKDKLKKKAAAAKLPYLKEESQDICFLSGEHNDFLKKNLQLKEGPIKTLDGQTVGKHQGLPLYTIGQRKGVELGGRGPYYVVWGDQESNTLYVTNKPDDPALFGQMLHMQNINWISGKEPKTPFKCTAVIRYRHQETPCVLKKEEDDGDLLVFFSKPQRAITPGQSVVFYKNNELLGGGLIN